MAGWMKNDGLSVLGCKAHVGVPESSVPIQIDSLLEKLQTALTAHCSGSMLTSGISHMAAS